MSGLRLVMCKCCVSDVLEVCDSLQINFIVGKLAQLQLNTVHARYNELLVRQIKILYFFEF